MVRSRMSNYISWIYEDVISYPCPTFIVKETKARPVASSSKCWAGQVENLSRLVKVCIEHKRDICFRGSALEI